MHTKGLQDEEDELHRFIIRPQPLVLTDEAEGEAVLLTVEWDLHRSIVAGAISFCYSIY